MSAIRSFQPDSRLSYAMRIVAALFAAVAAGCGGGYGGGSGGGMAASARPTITTQPMSQTVTAGSAVTFTVVASGGSSGYGAGGFTYQWMMMNGMNSSPIMGATMSSYIINPTTTAENGEMFFVAVTNSSGTTDSNMVTLTVM